jgi:hypothetical protein
MALSGNLSPKPGACIAIWADPAKLTRWQVPLEAIGLQRWTKDPGTDDEAARETSDWVVPAVRAPLPAPHWTPPRAGSERARARGTGNPQGWCRSRKLGQYFDWKSPSEA